ncbi:MAG: DUF4388 domain-containing protein [Deltaproteobacteria bacterium]|nr:DUF4388 domain-containing protein [Deltaproteobacteria bacterium]
MAVSINSAQVVVVADDPIEAGMLALDLVQAGVAAHAVRDAESAVQQWTDLRASRPGAVVLVSAFREVGQTVALWEALADQAPPPAFVAVVGRAQREVAQRYVESTGWAGVAVRPVNAEELVAVVSAATQIGSAAVPHETRTGSLEEETLVDLLGSLIDRIPRPGAGKTAILTLQSQGRNGVVALLDGDLVHAEIDHETGRHALERMAAWRRGTFRLDALPWRGQPTLSGSALALLAVAQEYARRIEEARQSLPYSDCVCTVRWERVRPLPVVAEGMFRRIASGQVLGEAIRGDGDDELEAFAALEARIKRGAVVPQVETSPRIATAPLTASDARSGSVPALAPAGSAAGHPSSGWSAVPMSLVDAPTMPERRRSHPTTHLYRIGSDGKALPSADPAEIAANLLGTPAHIHAISSQTTGKPAANQPAANDEAPPIPDAVRSATAVATHRSPTPIHGGAAPPPGAPRRPPSSLLSAGKVAGPGVRQTDLGLGAVGGRNRQFGSTGWFGVGPATESGVVAAEVGLDGRRPRSSMRIADSDQLVAGGALGDRNGAAGSAQTPPDRVAARPYAWIPVAQVDDEPEPEPPKPMLLLRPRVWPWVVAAGALVAVAGWLLAPRGPGAGPIDPAAVEFHEAVALLDGGHGDQARHKLVRLAALPNAQPEVLLHLAVLDLEARRFEAARKLLDAYITHPLAQHVDKAKKLMVHVFGTGQRQAHVDP